MAPSCEVMDSRDDIDTQGTDKHTDCADDIPHQHDLQLAKGRAPYSSVAHFQPISEPPGARILCPIHGADCAVNPGPSRSPSWAELPNKDSCQNQVDDHIVDCNENRNRRVDPNSTSAVSWRYLKIRIDELRSKESKKTAEEVLRTEQRQLLKNVDILTRHFRNKRGIEQQYRQSKGRNGSEREAQVQGNSEVN